MIRIERGEAPKLSTLEADRELERIKASMVAQSWVDLDAVQESPFLFQELQDRFHDMCAFGEQPRASLGPRSPR
jgi:hypothetical protein